MGASGTVERVAMGIVAIALVTTLVMNNHQTAQVFNSVGSTFVTAIKTAQGR